ncbi:hypothetical protein BO85DRAFT_465038 [Aspergillus piperis CBS 112811]|uniref:CHAT domain-containing protein n=1 Tax=Aspergillus piperis CBS 112811 TaxID=1448313 RepID=A0A8G1VSM5_9EURO|nr:hypothetical protein BO85DRAFT_465038 [Aspergillus piperis CBS 112811]RAH63095.1 hypothetical protein BO85DRAFT_465038 [Aspergillus piperis CBS 112811]
MSSNSESGENFQVYGERAELVVLPPPHNGSVPPTHNHTALYLISSPLPHDISTLKFDITSHDQGWCSNPKDGIWSWFAISILAPGCGGTTNPNLDDLSRPGCVMSRPEDFEPLVNQRGLYFKNLPKELAAPNSLISMRIAENSIQHNWVRMSVICPYREDNAINNSLFRLFDPGDRVVVWARAQISQQQGQTYSGSSKTPPEDDVSQNASEGALRHSDLDDATHASVVEAPPSTQDNMQEEFSRGSSLPESDMASGGDKKVVVSIDCFTDMLEKDLCNIPVDDPGRAVHLARTARHFTFLFLQFRRMEDIDKALAYYQEAVMLEPENPGHRSLLASGLVLKDYVTGNDQGLQLAITQLERATALEDDSPGKQYAMTLLAILYGSRHHRTGYEEDLHKMQSILATLGPEDPDCVVIGNLLRHESLNYSDEGMNNGEALDETIKLLNQTVTTGSLTDLTRPFVQMYTQLLHAQRSEQTGNTRDLDLAISQSRKLYDGLPDDFVHHEAAKGRRELSYYLIKRWERTKRLEDALEATMEIIKAYRAAPPVSEIKSDLISLLCTIVTRFEAPKHLDALYGNLINLFDNIDPHLFGKLSSQEKVKILSSRVLLYQKSYSITGKLTDLERSISLSEDILRIPGQHSRGMNLTLQNLAKLWVRKSIRTQENAAWMQALQYALEPCAAEENLPIRRVQCADLIVYCAIKLGEWEWACDTADAIFPLLPKVSGRDLEQDDKIESLRLISSFTTNVCTAYLSAMKAFDALLKLEQGRGVMMGDLFDSQSDLTALQQANSDLAREYETLRNRAFHRIGIDEMKRQSPNERRDAFQKLRHCELRIREMEGFENFLQSMTWEDISQCSIEGPVIIVNISDFASDAIVIVPSGPICLRMNDMKREQVPAFRNYLTRNGGAYSSSRDLENDISQEGFDYRDMLAWLWYTCVKHILDNLAFHQEISTSGQKTRVWWIGAGLASGLPFHAAGDYRGDPPDEDENCLSRVISSYIPTVKALRNARERATQAMHRVAAADKLSLLIATMPDTPGHGMLSGVRQEAERVTEVVNQAMNVRHMVEPSSEEDTAESGKVVDKLTVSKLLETPAMSRAWIAYLSACSTAEIRDTNLMNEGLHITSGFLIAGFSHIIGSIWPADDQISVDMAAFFYDAYVKRRATAVDPNRAVAEAVHDATLRIRKKYAYEPLAWASYTHVGV